MAYYTALINEWATLSGSTAQKLAAVNALTVSGSVPTTLYVSGAQLANCINWAEFAALTAQQQANLLALCQVPGNLLGGSSNTSLLTDGMFLAYFSLAGATIANLTALAQAAATPWSQVNGYSTPISMSDVINAGLS
jgi:hypothetical protein